MTGSPVSRPARVRARVRAKVGAKALLVATVALAAPLAHAQAPVQLNAPIQLNPPPGAVIESKPPAPSPPADLDGITIESIGEIDADSAGLIGVGNGGFPVSMWAGTPRGVAEALLPRLTPQASRVGRDLARRLLLSSATPPAGPASASLVGLRAGRLVVIGDPSAASSLAATLPRDQRDANISRMSIDSRLIANDLAGACVDAASAGLTSVYGQQVGIFCQLLDGQPEFANLGLTLLREQNAADPAFSDLVARLSGAEIPIDTPGEATPLTLAMLRASNAPMPDWFIDAAPPDVLAAIADSQNATTGQRLDAAWRGAAVGATDLTALAALYQSLDAGDVAVAGADPAAVTLAAGWISAASQTVPAARAEALSQYAAAANAEGVADIAAYLSASLLDEVAPSADLAWFAGTAARAWLAAGQPDRAAPWATQARTAATVDPDAAAAAISLSPLMRIAFAGSPPSRQSLPWDPEVFAQWLTLQPEPVALRGAFMLALLSAVGEPVATSEWSALAVDDFSFDGAAPPATYWLPMQQAAAAGRVAETVLLALLVLADAPLATHSPVTLHGVISALAAIGLESDARAMAVEAAIAAGL